ncbi:MAG: hypothetical protein J6C40_13455 [Lentisphaeria bacterium]|nr:hypothetical protein [Lentisphaeria bacterium]
MEDFASGLYVGSYTHTLDSQCRVSLPSEWRNRAGETSLMLLPASGDALQLQPMEIFTEFVSKLKNKAVANPKIQMALSFLGANARICRCDKQGRISLDRAMLDRIGVENQLRLIGAFSHIRLCAPDKWDSASGSFPLEECMSELQQASDEAGALAALFGGTAPQSK